MADAPGSARERITRGFLWLVVLAAGPIVGAKLFDLLVLAGAWSANPPASLALLPYGKAWPVDTGLFFIPFSSISLLAGFGALAAGWRTPWSYRWLLCLPSLGTLLLLVLTVAEFWPMNAALYYHAIGSPRDSITDAEAIAMVQRWITLDWFRVAGGAIVFVAGVRALTRPWPGTTASGDSLAMRIGLVLALAGVAGFVVWFLTHV